MSTAMETSTLLDSAECDINALGTKLAQKFLLLNNPENIPGDFPDIVADTRNVTVKYQLMRHSLIVQSTRCYSDASGGVVEVTAVDE